MQFHEQRGSVPGGDEARVPTAPRRAGLEIQQELVAVVRQLTIN